MRRRIPIQKKLELLERAQVEIARGKAALELLKRCLETSSLITNKSNPDGPQTLGIVMTVELAHAMCEEFGWNPEIISSNTMAEGSFEEKQNRDAMSTDPRGAIPKCEVCGENPASFLIGQEMERWICQSCKDR